MGKLYEKPDLLNLKGMVQSSTNVAFPDLEYFYPGQSSYVRTELEHLLSHHESFRRKLFFEIGGYDVHDTIPKLEKSIGLTLLEPHINYTNHVFKTLNAKIDVMGIAHITGGGMIENIPRILPDGCAVEIQKGSWPILPVFDVMQSLGKVDKDEMFRTFNMGIGMVFIVDDKKVSTVKDVLKDLTEVYEIGSITHGDNNVIIT